MEIEVLSYVLIIDFVEVLMFKQGCKIWNLYEGWRNLCWSFIIGVGVGVVRDVVDEVYIDVGDEVGEVFEL